MMFLERDVSDARRILKWIKLHFDILGASTSASGENREGNLKFCLFGQ